MDITLDDIVSACLKYYKRKREFDSKHGINGNSGALVPKGEGLTCWYYQDGAKWVEFVEDTIKVEGRYFNRVYCRLSETGFSVTDGFVSYYEVNR